ncbi:polyprenyl synthetase [Limosilactobacillus caccae]|uniref:polyprenyl synthetase n=1 Tax=Limosilactobacillus caccae TaxID=1926284 RepID=UPI0009713F8E|nr:polyprenyl synthetase [Limosilactobacillus caccae]
MNELNVDERLNDGLLAIISQFPPVIGEMLDLNKNTSSHRLRLALFQAISHLQVRDLTVDQITAAQLPELLALAAQTNPPAFQPAALNPGKVAQIKAGSYVASYLMSQFTNRLTKVGNPPQMIEELTIDGGDFMIAQIQRLQYNYNQRFKVANYLADQKARAGLLAKMSAKQSAVLAANDQEIVSLSGQIGEAIGVAAAIIHETQQVTTDFTAFCQLVTAGQYPLALLFASEAQPDWFTNFFNQPHRPSTDQFNQAHQQACQQVTAVKGIVTDTLQQVKLDTQVLPTGDCQQALLAIVAWLNERCDNLS